LITHYIIDISLIDITLIIHEHTFDIFSEQDMSYRRLSPLPVRLCRALIQEDAMSMPPPAFISPSAFFFLCERRSAPFVPVYHHRYDRPSRPTFHARRESPRAAEGMRSDAAHGRHARPPPMTQRFSRSYASPAAEVHNSHRAALL